VRVSRGATHNHATPVECPVENSDESPTISVAEWRAYVARLYDLSDLGEPHAIGECMECDRAPLALWIYGDFVICARCCRRRQLAGRLATTP
jgi:hypothetical protein